MSGAGSGAGSGPVLFLDSGIGGLSVLREARVLMPERRFVYVADDAAFPYGAWSEAALLAHLSALVARLVAAHAPSLVVIACNTASTLALAALRADHPGLPFVGTVPAIKPAAERTSSGLVSVLATPGTVRRAYTAELIATFAARCEVCLVGSDRLAALAEDHLRARPVDAGLIAAEIAPCFVEREGRRTDIVVLACTHYPFLVNEFRRAAPWPADWLDPAEAIARRALALLPEGSAAEGRDIAVLTSGRAGAAERRLFAGFGLSVV